MKEQIIYPGKPAELSVKELREEYAVTQELKLHFESGEIEAIRTGESNSIDAYVLFAKGSYYGRLYERGDKEEDFVVAVKMLEEAISIDPQYALAYWELGNIYEGRYVLQDQKHDLELMLDYYEKAYPCCGKR